MVWKTFWGKWRRIITIGGSTLTVISILGTTSIALDSRYSKEVDTQRNFKELKVQQIYQQKEYNEKIIANTKLLNKGLKELHIKSLEDKIFRLEFKEAKNTSTDLEKALLPRYKRELNKLQ